MPDTDSPEVTTAEKDLRIMLSEHGPDQILLNRKWSCPGDHTISAYTDGVLGTYKRRWVEFHLASCQRCRVLVADVLKAERDTDLPSPPSYLVRKAISSIEPRPVSSRWVWAPVGALAGIAILAVLTVLFRKPEPLVVLSPSTPSAPLVAKSEPVRTPRTPLRDVVRKPSIPELLPTILVPKPGSVMSSDRLQFKWRPISQSRNYEVKVVKSDGDLVWQGQTDKSALHVPDLALENGSYFVWITAYLEDGRTAKSKPVRFLVKR